MVATFATFCVLSPDAFLTVLTMKAILQNVTPLLILSLGVTVVLVMNDFDLSVGGQVTLLGTVAVLLLSTAHVGLNYWLAILLAILAGVGIGLFNGVMIAYAGAPSLHLHARDGHLLHGRPGADHPQQHDLRGHPVRLHEDRERRDGRVLQRRLRRARDPRPDGDLPQPDGDRPLHVRDRREPRGSPARGGPDFAG